MGLRRDAARRVLHNLVAPRLEAFAAGVAFARELDETGCQIEWKMASI